MNNLKKGIFTLLVALVGGFIALMAYARYFNDPKIVTVQQDQSMRYASLPTSNSAPLPDLTFAAENSVHSVVHIKVTQKGSYYGSNNIFDYFFGDGGYQQQQGPPRQGAGSRVIITPDPAPCLGGPCCC